MSIPFSPGKLQGQERKKVLQEVQKQAKAAARDAIKPVLEEFLEAEVTAKLGREKEQIRRISSQPRTIDWQCANQFIRDGHYRRNLGTGWGHVNDLRVPMLEYQHCRHDVVNHSEIKEGPGRKSLPLRLLGEDSQGRETGCSCPTISYHAMLSLLRKSLTVCINAPNVPPRWMP
jgi:hypothetical protein